MSDEEFQQADSGAAGTHPEQASALRKNGYVMLKGFPCKIVDMSTSKTGKHGHAKIHFVGIDIFTGKKYEDLCPSTHNMYVPDVTRDDFQVVDIDADGYVTVMGKDGETRSDLRVPTEGPFADVAATLKADFEAGKDLLVTVQSACGTEMIVAVKNLTT